MVISKEYNNSPNKIFPKEVPKHVLTLGQG
jgi:hypothetical protein